MAPPRHFGPLICWLITAHGSEWSVSSSAIYVILDINAMARTMDKPLVWLRGEVKTPPLGAEARVEAGFLLRRLQKGASLGLQHSRPMSSIGSQRHELRVNDENQTWRIVYHVAIDAVVILDVFSKKLLPRRNRF